MAKARFTPAEEQRIVDAIGGAERGNHGEVRVHVERTCPREVPLERAAELFGLLGMARTAESTGVLLYVAEASRQAAVFGGPGVHDAVGAEGWDAVVARLVAGWRAGRPVDGVVDALDHTGDLLRAAVPGEDPAGNEQPDTVTTS